MQQYVSPKEHVIEKMVYTKKVRISETTLGKLSSLFYKKIGQWGVKNNYTTACHRRK
jgi:hypothetical protein